MDAQKFYILKMYEDSFNSSGENVVEGMFQVSVIPHCTEHCLKCGATGVDMLVTDNSWQEYDLLYLCLNCLQKGLDEFKAFKEGQS